MGILGFLGKKVNDEDMGFWDHLDALRVIFFRVIGFVLTFSVVAFLFKDFVYNKIILGPKDPNFITNRMLNHIGEVLHIDSLLVKGVDFKLNNFELSGQFMNHMKISFIAGVILSMPLILWEIWKFIKPALTDHERTGARGFVLITNILFLLGVAFGYYIITPMSVSFLIQYQLSDQIQNVITLDSYLSMVLIMAIGSGLIFELPVVIYFLARMGIITRKIMASYRKHAVVILFVVAAIITPSPDPISMTIVAIPLIVLYEMSFLVAGNVEKNKKLKESTDNY